MTKEAARYNALGRLTGIDAGAGRVTFGYTYWDNENTIRKKTFDHRDGSPYNEYTYDTIDRLTAVAYHNSDTEGFVMDDLGNRDGNQTLRQEGTVPFAVNPLTNRYTAIASHPLDYDAAGNLTQDKDGYQFSYDYENRIVEVRNSSDALVAEFDYDTQGRRIHKISYDSVPSAATLYYYSDNWQVLAEYDGSDVQQAYYVFGNYIDEVLVMCRNSTDYYYLHDHLYSPVAILSATGAVVERYEYDAYGKVTIWNAAFTTMYTTSQYGNPYAFTGRELDTLDAGSCTPMHYRHRTYGPEMGRMYQHDPRGIMPNAGLTNPFVIEDQYSDGLNLYEYVVNNPIVLLDPMGLQWYVIRNGGPTATASVLFKPETIDNLASKIGLDTSEFKQWVTLLGTLKIEDGKHKDISSLSSSDKICPMQAVRIPNTVLAYWAGWGKDFGKSWVNWGRDVSYLSSLGFMVDDTSGWTAEEFQGYLSSQTKSKSLHGLFFWGHGYYENDEVDKKKKIYIGLITDNDKYDGTELYVTLYAKWKLEYKLALGIIFACGGRAAEDGRFTGDIFWGDPDTLYPIGTPAVRSIIKPGDQGTNKRIK